MFFKGLVTVLLAAILFASNARAQDVPNIGYSADQLGNATLYNLLKEKGIITDEELKTLKEDEVKSLTLGGRFEFAFKNVGGVPSNVSAGPSPSAGFIFRNVRLEATAQIAPNGYVTIQPEFDGSSQAPGVHLEDAYVGFRSSLGEIELGQHYVPFSLEALTSDKVLAFPERNLTSSLAPFRQLGVSVQGLPKQAIWWQFGIYNGTVAPNILAASGYGTATGAVGGSSWFSSGNYRIYGIPSSTSGYADPNTTGLLWAGRLEWEPLGNIGNGTSAVRATGIPKVSHENFADNTGFGLGLDYYSSANTPLKGQAANEILGSNGAWVDLQAKTGGLTFQAEYDRRTIIYADAGNKGQTAPQTAYSIQGTYLFGRTFSIALRYDNLTVDDNNLILGADKEKTDVWETAGVNWYFWNHNLKLQADYILKNETLANGTVISPNVSQAQVVYWF
jgi:hypothetical protein